MYIMLMFSEEIVSDMMYLIILLQVYTISIYHINCSLQVDTDVSRAPCDVGNMVIAYAIAICCISTPKAHTCLECHCSHIICIYKYVYIYIHTYVHTH